MIDLQCMIFLMLLFLYNTIEDVCKSAKCMQVIIKAISNLISIIIYQISIRNNTTLTYGVRRFFAVQN